MEKGVFHDTEEGTPQGGIISPILANMALDGLERKLRKEFIKSEKVNIIRYADDFIVTGVSKELLEQRVRPIVLNHIAERGLSLSEEKTKITHIREGFDFPGQNIRKFGKGKLIIRPSRKNFKNFLDKTRKIIRDNTHTHPLYLIRKLNPVIRGWANYHKHVVSKVTFGRADYEITRAILGWAKRRHPKKSAKWIKTSTFVYLNREETGASLGGKTGERLTCSMLRMCR